MIENTKSLNMPVPVCLVFVVMISAQCFAVSSKTIYLSGHDKDDAVAWDFYCTGGQNSGKWTTIPVPSNWELQGFGSYNYGNERQKSNEQGKYRKKFNIPESWQGKRIFIVFEGVMTDTEVTINGKSAGPVHQGGFYRFKYEITNLVKVGENLLEVTVSKVSSNPSVEQAERQADYWVFGGIYRPVYLEGVPREFIEWTAVDARADGTFSIDVHLNGLQNGTYARAVISESNGKVICEPFEATLDPGQEKVTLNTKINDPRLWTAETPNLYLVHVVLLNKKRMDIHTIAGKFGFRTFEVRSGDGLYLNGRKTRLKGVNRHSFWPDSGRCLSRKINYDDVKLIKQMNMNAVRMSHYPPDVHFLEACDELGLYVLDELAGWQQPPYDTDIGKKLVKELVTRDVSHPCILFWDNGNEGGWNTELDEEFALYDPQKRTVLHPWETFGGIDTDHYESYESTIQKLSGQTLFMPTEFLHGLYDGGHGAGLKDYWDAMYASPMCAGGFLWAFADEGVVRTDRIGRVDVAGNQAPDGIVGPYHEKEASFYAIKEIFSPVQIALKKLTEDFNGILEIENRYDFTNLSDCVFELQLVNLPGPLGKLTEARNNYIRNFAGPDVEPHNSGHLYLSLPENWRLSQVMYLTARDPDGDEIWTWSWDIQGWKYYEKDIETKASENTKTTAFLKNNKILIEMSDMVMNFDADSGELIDITVNEKPISFSGGPKLIGGTAKKPKVTCKQIENKIVLTAESTSDISYARWTIYPTKWIELEYELELEGRFYKFGINFDYPESKMRAMKWLGRGPYRVWKNRLQGGRLDVFSNNYKNHIPGATWDYPEFKGYYQDWRWVVFKTEEGDITIVNGTDDSFLGVYRPNNGESPMRTRVNVPETGISFLHGIPAIGTKGQRAESLGPQGQMNQASGKYKGKFFIHFGK